MSLRILLHPPHLNLKDKKYLNNTIAENWISTAGPNIKLFENKIKKYTNSKYCVALSSGTSALHLALKVLGVKKDDEVIVPSLTFIATINPIRYLYANPIFMDSDKYFNLDFEKTLDFLKKHTYMKSGSTYNKYSKRKISAIIPVHVWGNAAYLDDLYTECKKRKIKIVEDASESLGTWYKKGKFKNKHAGTVGDIGCLSFNSNKIITSGGGGAIITNSYNNYKKIKLLAAQARSHKINFIHSEVGYNYKMTSLHASIGNGQLDNINNIISKKKKIRELYEYYFKKKNLEMNPLPSYSNNNCWMNLLNLETNDFKKISRKIRFLLKKNIETRPVWHLNHRQEPYRNFKSYKISYALYLFNNYLCLPSGLTIKETDIKKISSFF